MVWASAGNSDVIPVMVWWLRDSSGVVPAMVWASAGSSDVIPVMIWWLRDSFGVVPAQALGRRCWCWLRQAAQASGRLLLLVKEAAQAPRFRVGVYG